MSKKTDGGGMRQSIICIVIGALLLMSGVANYMAIQDLKNDSSQVSYSSGFLRASTVSYGILKKIDKSGVIANKFIAELRKEVTKEAVR